MPNPTIRINNGEEIIDREMTAEELEQWESDKKIIAADKAAFKAAEEKRNAALAKLQDLGLTVEDLKVLGL